MEKNFKRDDSLWRRLTTLNQKNVKGTKSADNITNGGSQVTINALGDNDTIISSNDSDFNSFDFTSKVSINGGAGNNLIQDRCDYSTFQGGDGNDNFDGFFPDSILDAGAGNDSINAFCCMTITGGKGNDLISLYSVRNLIKYKSGDGFDIIYGFHSTDTLTISGGSYSTTASGKDIIVKVGKGKITLKNAKGNAININGKNVGGKSTNEKFILLTYGDDKIVNN